MRKKTKSKKTKQKQKQKQSQSVRQTVNVNLGNISKRRPQRRTGTRTAPMVTYQQTPIPLAPSVDFGKLEHTISSLQNNILHSIKNRENNNLLTTPPIHTPAPKSNLMTGLQAAQREEEQKQEADDRNFAQFIQGKETVNESAFRKLKRTMFKGSPPESEKTADSSALREVRRGLFNETPSLNLESQRTALEQADDAIKQMNIALGAGAVRQTGIPTVEGRPLKGRPKKGTQVAEPVNPQQGFVSPEPRRGQPKPQQTGEFEAKPQKKKKKEGKSKDVTAFKIFK